MKAFLARFSRLDLVPGLPGLGWPRHHRYRELEGLHEISQAFAAMTEPPETVSRPGRPR